MPFRVVVNSSVAMEKIVLNVEHKNTEKISNNDVLVAKKIKTI